MDANEKEGPYNQDIKNAVRWLRGKGIIKRDKDIIDKTEYGKSTISGYISGKISASPEFRRKFEEVFELDLSEFEGNRNMVGEATVPYGKNVSESSPINIKTASGKTIAIVAEGSTEVQLLNALLEERERFITQIENENEKLTRIIESGLIDLKSNLKEVLDDLQGIEFAQRAQHTVMFHSLERLEKKKPGTFEKELNTLERAYSPEDESVGKKIDLNK